MIKILSIFGFDTILTSQEKQQRLSAVTTTIVSLLDEVGLYRYNKLTFLFEYLFIKNFGERYTTEKFYKLPHGPAIVGYKKQIAFLASNGIVDVDVNELLKQRELGEDKDSKIFIPIRKNKNTDNNIVQSPVVFDFLQQVVDRYRELDVDDLERTVYMTTPMKKFKANPNKRKIGGYILSNDCIKMHDYKNTQTIGRLLALKHAEKYPHIDHEQQQRIEEEFKYLSSLSPYAQ